MYYELYIDVLFLENFMMDSLILLAVNRILKCNRTCGRIFAGGAAGSLLTCLVIMTPLSGVLKLFLFHVVINSLMIVAGLRIRSGTQFVKAFLLLYLAAFAAGGLIQLVRPYIRSAAVLYTAAVVFYFLFSLLWKKIPALFRRKAGIYRTAVYVKGERYELKALCDTGNVLTDPLTGDPVSILDPGVAEYIFGLSGTPERFRYIPYRCVSGESVMKIFRAEKMCVAAGEETWIQSPLLGVGETALSGAGEYQMLLNPDIFYAGGSVKAG